MTAGRLVIGTLGSRGGRFMYDVIAAKKASDNPIFKEIIDSQKVFAERAVKWDMDNNVNRRMAYNHYFGAKNAPPAKKA